MEKTSKYALILTRIDTYINNVDSKASIGLAFVSIIIGIFTSYFLPVIKCNLTSIFELNANIACTILKISLILSITIFMVFGIRSLIFLVKVIIPDTNISKYQKQVPIINSKLFFGTIARSNFEEFIKEEEETVFINDLQSQAYINSKICDRKFKNFGKAIDSLKKLAIPLIISIVISLFF
jgi:hypothetical protein